MYKLSRSEMDALRSIFPRVKFIRTRKNKGRNAGRYYVTEQEGISKAVKRIRSGKILVDGNLIIKRRLKIKTAESDPL